MCNWILGRSIDSNREDELEASENFRGYLVHLEYPRCIVAVGNLELLNEKDAFSLSPDAGYFFSNECRGFSLVLTEWLDDPVADAKEVSDYLFAAASHYCIVLEDAAESAIDEMEGVI